jgi:phenylpropionate dioxygenase-like ring-hydroxylating dioxygenase large terminal subunit
VTGGEEIRELEERGPTMIDRDEAVALAKRLLAFHESGTTEQAADVYRVPTAHYIDPDRWQLEMDRIFRRVPLPLALTCELRDAGSFKSFEAAGVPVLIVRGSDGRVRAFVNACRHRGAIVEAEPCGRSRRFTCPYHGWVYDQRGGLTGMYGADTFGPVDREPLGLTPLPCEERAGLVFVTLRPGEGMDIDDWLGDYAAELETLELDTWHVHARRELDSPAWKVAFDGYLEGYHFSTLHKDTIFKDNMSNLMAVDAFGPHQRIMFAKHTLPRLRDQDESQWRPTDHIGPVHTIFPCLSLAGAWRDTALVSQLFPGPTADRSRTAQTFISRHPAVTAEERERVDQAVDFLFTVVRDEDYATGLGITRGLLSGINQEFVFGRNEPSLHHFHQWVDRLIS